jgi:agmatinase
VSDTPDEVEQPRFVGVQTFMHLPLDPSVGSADVAVLGLPFDGSATYRPGARFGPAAVRSASGRLAGASYNAAQRVDVFDRLTAVDAGDAPVVPGNVERSLALMEAAVARVHDAGALPLCIGGEHGVTLAELRAAAQRHGQLGLVLFDAHHDAWDEEYGERYGHGTWLRRALDEELIDARRSTLLGMRGGLGADDLDDLRQLGFVVFPFDDLMALGTGTVAGAVERASGKTFLSFDIDFVDPAFAPGTGTPEVGGPTSAQALALLRGCRGLGLVGADVVEVAPDLDPTHLTATLAATAAWEVLSLVAAERPEHSG